jgi:integrase
MILLLLMAPPAQIKELMDSYLRKGQLRNYVLIILSVHTALRISDLQCLLWDDVYDFGSNRVRQSIYLVEKKAHKPNTIVLNKAIIDALTLYSTTAAAPGRAIIENTRTRKAISRIQAIG